MVCPSEIVAEISNSVLLHRVVSAFPGPIVLPEDRLKNIAQTGENPEETVGSCCSSRNLKKKRKDRDWHAATSTVTSENAWPQLEPTRTVAHPSVVAMAIPEHSFWTKFGRVCFYFCEKTYLNLK